jgi:hypothetical protein
MRLYRPVGLYELEKMFDAQMRAFPPRLPEQPIFYPVLNADYAVQIARGWNTKQPPFAGYVTAFEVDDAYAARFERKVVGNRTHEELWVPAEELAEFNRQIAGPIRVIEGFFGEAFEGHTPRHGALKGRSARQQLATLARLLESDPAEARREIQSNQKAVFLHFPYWRGQDFTGDGLDPLRQQRVLGQIRTVWGEVLPSTALPH